MKYVILLLSLLCVLYMSHSAGAALAAGPAATVQTITPEAWAISQGQRAELAIGQGLQAQDSLHTGASGSLGVRFSDGTQLNLRALTSVDIADYVFDDNASFSLNIGAGAATLVTGAIVQQNPQGFNLTTPLGTVGVRGTTIYVSVSNDKVSIVVTDMAPGHSVVVMGLDGNSVTITEPGMQVDLIRGEPTPPSAGPATQDTLDAIDNPEDSTFNELPHRDVGEQSMLLMEQDMNAVSVVTPLPVVDNPTPPTPRTTYPAFLMGLENAPGASASIYSAMSGDGRYVVNYDSGDIYLWDMQAGTRQLLASQAPLSSFGSDISADGQRVLTWWGSGTYNTILLVYETIVYDLGGATPSPLYFSIPAGLAAENSNSTVGAAAISANGNVVVGSYMSTALGNNIAVSRYDYNGSGYEQVAVYNAATSDYLRGSASAVNSNGSVIGGSNNDISPAYWIEQGTSKIYDQYVVDSVNQGEVTALTPDGQYGAGYTYDVSFIRTAFRVQTSGNTVIQISPPATFTQTTALAISNDGGVVAGSARDSSLNERAFFWEASTNASQLVETHLANYNVNLGGAELNQALAISADGSILLCYDDVAATFYLARIDGDYLGLTSPSNIYASIAGVEAGTAANQATQDIMSQLSNITVFSLGNVPSSGEMQGGGVLRVWGSGTFSSDYSFNGDDRGAIGAAGATYFMDNGFSIGGGVFYSYRDVDSLWGSRQENESISLGLFGGYAPERTGLRLSLGLMGQSYDLDTMRNYPNGAGLATSSGKGSGWGMGATAHAGWVFDISESVTIQPFAEYTFQRIATPEYEEMGGPFPVSYERHHFNQNITRIGADLQWDILPTLNLQAWLAWNHRFEDEGPASSGQIIGYDSFYFPGGKLKQNWGDTGLGLRWRVYDNTTIGCRLGFGIDNKDSGLADVMGTLSVSVDI